APRRLGGDLRGPVSLHQLHVGEAGVAHVQRGLLQPRVGAGPGVVDVVVGDDVAAAGGPHGERLVHVIDDVVLDEGVAGVRGEGEAVSAAALDHVGRMVEVAFAYDRA